MRAGPFLVFGPPGKVVVPRIMNSWPDEVPRKVVVPRITNSWSDKVQRNVVVPRIMKTDYGGGQIKTSANRRLRVVNGPFAVINGPSSGG